ncbi:MAG TPA: hypothetical protein PLA68_16495, partial [Panacibacter sp.]|nr:hypothetical protein [Panacibacter sp.]
LARHLFFMASPVASHTCTEVHQAATPFARNRQSQFPSLAGGLCLLAFTCVTNKILNYFAA